MRMSVNKKNTILMLTYHHYPCDEPVLETVFSRELGKKHKIVWLLKGDRSGGDTVSWNNTQVLLTRRSVSKRFGKYFNKIYSLLNAFIIYRLLRSGTIKIILVRDMPLSALFLCKLKERYQFRLYYQHTAPLGDMNIGYFKGHKASGMYLAAIKGYLYNLFIKKALKRSDLVFPITEYHKEELSHYVERHKLVPLTMGVDKEWLARKPETIEFISERRKTGYVIAYFGTLAFVRNPHFLLDVFASLKAIGIVCTFLLIGKTSSVAEENELKGACLRLGLGDDVIFTGYTDRNSLQDYLYYCDLTLSPIPPTEYYIISSPTKVYESLGNGVPVVGNREILEQEKVLRESGGGIVVDYDVRKFAAAIAQLLADPVLREVMSANGRDYILKKYSYQAIAEDISPYFD